MHAKTAAALCATSALATALLLSACSTAQTFNFAGAATCYGPTLTIDADNAEEVAGECAQAAQQTWPSVLAIANAAYHAGVAERRLGEQAHGAGNAHEANRHFTAAVALLERAISLAPATTSGRVRPPAKADAMLQLAWVRFGQGNYQSALAQIDELLRLEGNPESAVHASAHYLRGLTLDADGQALPALTDWDVFVDDALDQHAYAPLARRQIIAVATRLGLEALARNNRADAQAAIELFVRAKDAAESAGWEFPAPWPIAYASNQTVDRAGIFINLGRARMALAGFNSREGLADFNCAPDAGAPETLSLARADFVSATEKDDRNDSAWRELSCAESALGRPEAAVAAAERATQLAAPAGAERALDYRMLGRARARLGSAAGAVAAFEEARLHAPNSQWRSRVLTELASVYVSDHQTALARERLLEAINGTAGDPNYAPALLMLGASYFGDASDPQDYANAETYLLRAEHLTDPAFTMHEIAEHERNRAVRAETLYHLSRLRIEWPGHYNGQDAIRFADEAFRLEGSTLHRAQACLARVSAGNVGLSTPAQGYCSAMGQAAPVADSYLYEGVYHLRRAQYLRGGDHDRALESAYRSFSDGLRLLPSGTDRLLQAKLLQGQAIAQYCVGFAIVGHDLEASIARMIGGDDALAVAREAHKFFDDYRVGACDGSRRVD